MPRDHQLDIYRALTMVFILCATHIVYLLEVFGEPIRSVVLIEMPIIFFIAGASQQLARKKNLAQTVVALIRRLAGPFYTFLAVLLLLLWLLTFCCPEIGNLTIDMRQLTMRDYAKILLTGSNEKIIAVR